MRRSSSGSGYASGKISLREPDHSSDNARILVDKLNEDRTRNNCFCDFTIKTSTRDYPIHKCVIGVMSDFFKKMFTSNMKEMYEKSATLEGISDDIMEMVIAFIYNNDIRLNMNNAYNLLEAADYLQMSLLQACCIKFLVQNLSPENALRSWEAAKLYNTDNFLFDCETYISNQFASILKQKKHLVMDLETILHFIGSRDSSTPEQLLFEGVVSWVEHDKVARLEHFSNLFKLIDLNKLPKSYINCSVMNNDLVLDCHECSKILLKAMRSHFHVEQNQSESSEKVSSSETDGVVKGNDSSSSSMRHASFQETVSSGDSIAEQLAKSFLKDFEKPWHATSSPSMKVEPNISGSPKVSSSKTLASSKGHKKPKHPQEFVVIGGESSSQYLRKYDVVSKKWSKLPNHSGHNVHIGAALVSKILYVIGGQQADSTKSFNSLESWNMEKLSDDETEWLDKDCMFTARYKFGCAVLNNLIFVAGGLAHKTKWLNSVESYNIRRNKWVERPSMSCNRGECSLVQMGGLLYVLGGCQSSKVYHSTTEIFDGNHWEMGPTMQTERAGLAAVVLNNEIFAIGGRSNEDNYLASVEKLSFGSWRYVGRLKVGRSGHCACVIDGKIYVAGGSNAKGATNPVEVYDPSSNQWQIIGKMFGDARGIAMLSL